MSGSEKPNDLEEEWNDQADVPLADREEAPAWTDKEPTSGPSRESPQPGSGALVETTPFAEKEQAAKRKHAADMQKWVLLGVGAMVVIVFTVTYAGVWNHAVDPDFAERMSRFILPSLVGSGTTIVGAVFIGGGRREP